MRLYFVVKDGNELCGFPDGGLFTISQSEATSLANSLKDRYWRFEYSVMYTDLKELA
jgi:hypothetical protein